MKGKINIELFSRPNCHLCDVAVEIIENLHGRYPLRLKVTHVEKDPQLEKRFGTEVPVVCIDGDATFKYPIEPAKLERELNRLWNL